MPLLLIGAALLAMTCPAAAPAAATHTKSSNPPVVLLILDEFSLGTMMTDSEIVDARRFPNFASLGETATWYRRHTTVSDVTGTAVPAIYTGQRPDSPQWSTTDKNHNIFEMLKSRYRIQGYEPLHEARAGSCEFCAKPADASRLLGVHIHTPDTKLPKLAGAIRAIDGSSKKPLFWSYHVLLPHVGWTRLSSGDKYNDSELPYPGMVVWGWGISEHEYEIALSQQRMLMQAQYVDKIVGGLRARLESKGIWDDALVIVTADHGGSFTPGQERRSIDTNNFAQIASVPLFVKYPNQRRGSVSLRDTNSTQILPTVAKLTDSPAGYQGTSLLDAPRRATVTVKPSDNEPSTLELSVNEMLSQQRAEIRQRDRRFPHPNLFYHSDNGKTIGKQVRQLDVQSTPSPGSITLDNPEYFNDMRPGSGWLPAAYLTAHTTGLPAGAKLAVAVNGRIVGDGQTFSYPILTLGPNAQAPSMRFAALLNPDWMKPGRATVSFYRESANGLQRVRIAK